MRVPDGCGQGKATVKVSFPGLTTLKVAEGTFAIEVKPAEVVAAPPGASCGAGK